VCCQQSPLVRDHRQRVPVKGCYDPSEKQKEITISRIRLTRPRRSTRLRGPCSSRTTEQEQKNDENHYQSHARGSLAHKVGSGRRFPADESWRGTASKHLLLISLWSSMRFAYFRQPFNLADNFLNFSGILFSSAVSFQVGFSVSSPAFCLIAP